MYCILHDAHYSSVVLARYGETEMDVKIETRIKAPILLCIHYATYT